MAEADISTVESLGASVIETTTQLKLTNATLAAKFIQGTELKLFDRSWQLNLLPEERIARLHTLNKYLTNDCPPSEMLATFSDWLNTDGETNVPRGEFETPTGKKTKSVYGAAIIDINVYWANKRPI